MKKELSRYAAWAIRRSTVGSVLVFATLAWFSGISTLMLPATPIAQAASLTALSDTMSNQQVSTSSSHVIKFTTPSGASTSTATIVVTFPSDFDFTSKTIGTLTFTHGTTTGAETTETLAASPSGSAWGAVFSGGATQRILTLTPPTDGIGAGGLFASQKVILTYDSTNSITPTTPGNYAITINGVFGDTGTITVPILTNDQVSVTATVNQSLTFTISDNTIGYGALSVSAATYATGDTLGTTTETEAHNLIANTNASTGYTIAVTGATLTDSSSHTIDAIGGTNTASSIGSEQFGLRASVSGSGSGTVTAPYAASGFAYAATATTTSQVASAGAATASNTYSVRYIANVSATTEAGAYTAALNYLATANF